MENGQVLGFCGEEDRKDLRTIWEACFDDTPAFVDYYFRKRMDPLRCMALRECGEMVAALHLNRHRVEFLGKNHDVSYFVGVSTYEVHRGKGHMRKLMEAAIRELHAEGELFSLLMPVDSRLYDRFGFAFVEDHLQTDFNPEHETALEKEWRGGPGRFPARGSYRMVDRQDPGRFRQEWEGVRAGMISCYGLEMVPLFGEGRFQALVEELAVEDGGILLGERGYAAFYPGETLEVREIAVLDRDAMFEILRHLREKAGKRTIGLNTHLKDCIKYLIPYTNDNTIKVRPFMMARILDARRLLAAYVEAHPLEVGRELRIQVLDGLIPENNRTFALRENHVEVLQGQEVSADLALGIDALAQLVFGYGNAAGTCFLHERSGKGSVDLPFLERAFPVRVHYFNEWI
nr:GNAT family N-acetyltransferase [Anaerotalea alkaliphila]